jgi:hypothetical protein
VSQFVAVVALYFEYIFLCTAFSPLMLICTLVDLWNTSARPTLPCCLALVFALKPIWFALLTMGDKGCKFGCFLALRFQFHMTRYINKVLIFSLWVMICFMRTHKLVRHHITTCTCYSSVRTFSAAFKSRIIPNIILRYSIIVCFGSLQYMISHEI